ncbi:zinc ribbon domain-containing protein [Roseburia hominis]|uniref:zinc ribbon domain-containing protein n=1 Tax=Roseburia hominis TaxID=301301 RepID=UPI0026EA8B27|nr:zinc ribbon domain-containing protein [Roseburia hominis]MCI7523532.1 zinc ribbon domain-containing protein [Roseburia hominis]
MYCRKCGKKLEDKSQYCEYCGAKVSNEIEQMDVPSTVGLRTNRIWVSCIIVVVIIVVILVGVLQGKRASNTIADNEIQTERIVTEKSEVDETENTEGEQVESSGEKWDLGIYQSILDTSLEEQRASKLKDVSEQIAYYYFYNDFNQDGYEELVLRKEEYNFWDTISVYGVIDGKVEMLLERQDETYYDNIDKLMLNGFSISGCTTSDNNFWTYCYIMQDDSFVVDAEFQGYEAWIDESNFEASYRVNIGNTTYQLDSREEYDNMLSSYYEENAGREVGDIWIPLGDTNGRDERLSNLPDSVYAKVSPEAATNFFNDVLPWKVTAELISCEEIDCETEIRYKASNTDAVAIYSIRDEHTTEGYYHPDYEYLYADSGWNEYGSDYPVIYFFNGVPSNNEEIYNKIYEYHLGGNYYETDYELGNVCTLRNVETGEDFTISLAEESISMNNIVSVYATSSLVENNMTHAPERIMDSDVTTAWVEGAEGYGENETIVFDFDNNYQVQGFLLCRKCLSERVEKTGGGSTAEKQTCET